MIEKFIGKSNVKMRADIGVRDANLNKQCLDIPAMYVGDDSGMYKLLKKDHLWFSPTKKWSDKSFNVGDVVEFTCSVREYIGLDEQGVQCTKVGIHRIRQPKLIKKD